MWDISFFFYNKVNDLKQQIAPWPVGTSLHIFSIFKLILLSFLSEMLHMKWTQSHLLQSQGIKVFWCDYSAFGFAMQ